MPVGGYPAWGVGLGGEYVATNWGYNEWNREFSITEPFQGDATVGLANLKAGDGKQVVKLPSFTPVRTLKDGVGSVTAKNVIGGTVAYSYPAHGYEVTKGWTTPKLRKQGKRDASEPAWVPSTTGDPGSMDSPFDFVWKMRQQKADIGDGAVQGLAPGNAWWNYVVTKPTGDMGNDLNPGDVRYVPSLGLYLGMPGSSFNEGYIASGVYPSQDGDDPDTWPVQAVDSAGSVVLSGTHQRRNASWIIEAGTDCVGFAQRAASYSGRKYEWVPLPQGLMEGDGSEDIYAVMDRYHAKTAPIAYRNYPSDEEESKTPDKDWPHVAYNVLHNRGTTYDPTSYRKTKGTLTSVELASLKKRLLQIVPGDIWVKDSTSSPDPSGDNMREHIAIVAYVPPNAAELSVTDLMDQIILIEGEYTNKIQSVIKKLSVGMYNGVGVPVGTQIYSNFVMSDADPDTPGNQPLNLKCQSWAIRRLR